MTQLRKKKLSQKGDVLLDVLKSHRKHSARVLQFRKTFQHNKNDKPIKLYDIVLLAAHHLSRWVYCIVFDVLQKDLMKKFKTLTTNPKCVTDGHF